MTFNLKNFVDHLNQDSDFRRQFADNPREVLATEGLDVSEDDAEGIRDSLRATVGTTGPTPQDIITIPIPVR